MRARHLPNTVGPISRPRARTGPTPPPATELTQRIITIADFRARQLGVTFASGSQEKSAAALAEDAATGKIVTTVTAYPLDQAAAAQQVSDDGHVRGKLVLTVD